MGQGSSPSQGKSESSVRKSLRIASRKQPETAKVKARVTKSGSSTGIPARKSTQIRKPEVSIDHQMLAPHDVLCDGPNAAPNHQQVFFDPSLSTQLAMPPICKIPVTSPHQQEPMDQESSAEDLEPQSGISQPELSALLNFSDRGDEQGSDQQSLIFCPVFKGLLNYFGYRA